MIKAKKLILSLAPLLGLMTISDVMAVSLSQGETGQALIFPYYSVLNGNDTYVSVSNNTASHKAVKIRFIEGKNGRDVLNFNVYLDANDMWTAALVDNGSGGTKLVTKDKTCTSPAIPAAGVDFSNYAYAGLVKEGLYSELTPGGDGSDDSLARTKEGYFEVIEMGVLSHSAIVAGITHDNGVPVDCEVVNTAEMTTLPGMSSTGGAFALDAPTGGLSGSATLINVLAGTDVGLDPVVLTGFSSQNLWSIPASSHPNLSDVNPKTSVVLKNGAAVTSDWTGSANPADPVSAVLMNYTTRNSFVLDNETLSGTDWVLTMPTKRFYVPVNDGVTQNGTPTPAIGIRPFTSAFWSNGSCDPISVESHNREGAVSVSFTPHPAALCWTSNIVTFNNSNLLGSVNKVNEEISTTMVNGKSSITFAGLNQSMASMDTPAKVYYGLPVIGFMVQDFINGNVNGLLANYAGNFKHKFVTNINGSLAE